MLTIELKMKSKLNQLIVYYRKESNHETFLAKNFILDENNQKICDLTTLSKLENNKIYCRDEIYFSLLKKLNKKYTSDPQINKLLQSVNQVLLNASENNDKEKIIHTITKIKPLLSSFKTYIVYEELLEIYELIFCFYKEGNFEQKYIDKYFVLYDLVEEPLRPIFLTIAFQYYSRIHIDTMHSFAIIEKSLDLKIHSIGRIFLLCAYYTRNNQKNELITAAHNGLTLCKKRNNTFYLSKFYNLLSYSYRFVDNDKAIHYMKLCIKHFDSKTTPYRTLVAYYTNMAHLAFDCKKYKDILAIYYNTLYNDLNFLQSFFYLLIESIHQLNEDQNEIKRILSLLLKHSEKHHPFHKDLLNLYRAIYFYNSFEEISDAIKALYAYKAQLENEELMKAILKEEIKRVCIYYNRYQLYTEAMKIFQ